MKSPIRPLRFLAFSVPLFFAWQYVLRQPYLRFLAEFFAGSARLLGLDVRCEGVDGGNIDFSYGDIGWTDQFGLTGINLVALWGLLLSTACRRGGQRLRWLAAGTALLFATQVLGLWTDIAHVHLHVRARGFADALRAFMTGFGTFLFPLAIWLYLARDSLPFAAPAPRPRSR